MHALVLQHFVKESRLGSAMLMVFSSGNLSVAWGCLDAATFAEDQLLIRAPKGCKLTIQNCSTSRKNCSMSFADAADCSDCPLFASLFGYQRFFSPLLGF